MDDTVLKGDNMIEVVKLIRERKWDLLIVFVLLVIVAILMPLATRQAVNDAIVEGLQPLTIAVEETRESVKSLERWNVTSLQNSAIVAYNKIETIDDLDPLTQNGLAIREGLKVPEIREVLASIDLERTLTFEAYFAGN